MVTSVRPQGIEEHEFSTPYPLVGSLHLGEFVRRQRFLTLSKPVNVFSQVRQRGFRQAVECTVQLLSGDGHGQHLPSSSVPRGDRPRRAAGRARAVDIGVTLPVASPLDG